MYLLGFKDVLENQGVGMLWVLDLEGRVGRSDVVDVLGCLHMLAGAMPDCYARVPPPLQEALGGQRVLAART
jgi:hypothetical protein